MRQKLLAAINDSVRGKFSVARLDGSVWGSLTLIDVRLADNESEIARIPRLKVNYALLPLIWGRIQVLRLEVSQPLVWLKEGRDGVWNIVEALSPTEPQSETPSLVVSISSVELQKADVDVSFSGRSYRLTDLDLKARLEFARTRLLSTATGFFSCADKGHARGRVRALSLIRIAAGGRV